MKRIAVFAAVVIVFCLQLHQDGFGQEQKLTDFCELFDDSAEYNEKSVATETVLFVPINSASTGENSEVFLYSTNCNNRDYFALADFSEVENLEILKRTLNEHSVSNAPGLLLVTIEGRFSNSLPPKHGHLSAFRARFEVTNIRTVNAVTASFGLPDMDKEAPVLAVAEYLSRVNLELMFYMLGRKPEDIVVTDLLEKTSRIYFNQKHVSSENFFNSVIKIEIGVLEHTVREIIQTDDKWRVKGLVVNKLKDRPDLAIEFDNTYRLGEHNTWKLVSMKASSSSVLSCFQCPIESGWKGIRVFESKKSQVDRLLGEPDFSDGEYRYTNDDVVVSVVYSRPCTKSNKKFGEFRLEQNTVLQYQVNFRTSVSIQSIVWSREKYEKFEDPHLRGLYHYYNEEDAIHMTTSDVSGVEVLSRIMYERTVVQNTEFRCGNKD